ncbi:MAG: MoaD/ThiS family protein [Candidatus Hodarchaeales archaeon]
MITVKLSFFALLQEHFGKERYISIDRPIRLIELFQLFKSDEGEYGCSYFLDNANLKSGFTILIDGRNIQALDRLKTILVKNCEVSFFPVIAGG